VVPLTSLWLPILVSAVFVFVASCIVHVVLPVHRRDWAKLPTEDAVLDHLRQAGVAPDNYMFPHCTGKDMATEPMKEKWARGPVGFLIVRPSGPPAMGKALAAWFVFTLVVGVFVAYLAASTLPAGTPYLQVFRVTGTAAFLAYAFGSPLESIFKGLKWGTTARFALDGLFYALVTAGVFGWLWPR
jgi:hypothetical protein